MTLARMYLYAQLAAFLGFAVLGYGTPSRFASALGMSLSDVTAIADFSATYGGLSAGISVVLILGATRPAWERFALTLAVAVTAGLFIGRLITLIQHGPAGLYIHGSMALEVVAVVAGTWLLRRGDKVSPGAGR